jgi:threonylcarbamoyladenosine tRNA methylthiotransferase CDKAL1
MAKVFSEQYGCSASLSDNEMMLGLLKQAGFKIVDDSKASDLNLIVTCTVKVPTKQRMIYRIKELSKLKKPLIVAGCLAKTYRKEIEKINPKASLISPDGVEKIVDVVRSALNGNKIVLLDDVKKPKLNLPRCRKNSVIGIIQISRGCICNCRFCIEPYKGKLFSYPQKMIVDDVKSAVNQGCKELWLTSLDCGCYGFDSSTDIAKLLNLICSVKGNFLVRIGMSNPMHVRKVLDDLTEAYKNEKVFKFLHLPVQSFSPKVLKLMGREYATRTVAEILEKFYRAVPELTFSTDIIVGFPGEDEGDFEMTLKFVEKFRPDIVNISKFGAHSSLKMNQLPDSIVNKRSRELYELARKISLEKNQKWIGWTGKILIDERGRGNSWMGRNLAYKPVVIRNSENILGKFVQVKITDITTNYLIGENI